MIVCITEKPSVAESIAKSSWSQFFPKEGYYWEGNGLSSYLGIWTFM